jgi:hypothetical protein
VYSFRFVVYCMLGFIALIAVVLFRYASSKRNRNANKLTSSGGLIFSAPDEIPLAVLNDLDAILVLGGGVPESVDHPPKYVERRADDAAAVVLQRFDHLPHRNLSSVDQHRSLGSNNNKKKSKTKYSSNSPGLPILCLSAGTAHLPQLLSADGLPIWESTACAAYLSQQHGLTNVFVETTSYDTIGNAFYTRTTHTDVNGWRKLLVVTNEFHMERTKAIFNWIFLELDNDNDDDDGKKKKKKSKSNNNYQLYYLESPNVGLTPEAVQARRERETASTKTVREKLIPKYTSLQAVWRFLTHEHSLYTASKLVDRGRGMGVDAKKASEIVQQSYGGAGSN